MHAGGGAFHFYVPAGYIEGGGFFRVGVGLALRGLNSEHRFMLCGMRGQPPPPPGDDDWLLTPSVTYTFIGIFGSSWVER